MISKSVIRLLALRVLTLSVTALPTLVHGDTWPSPFGGTPATQWSPSGPSADKIFYSFFDSDTSELNAMCVGQPSGCTPSIDLTDIPLPGSDLQAAGCVPNAATNGGCAENDPRFWITTATPQLGMLQIDFNPASTLWGITFCNGRDGVVARVTQCLDGVAGAPITASCPNVPAPHTGDCTWALIVGQESSLGGQVLPSDRLGLLVPFAAILSMLTVAFLGAFYVIHKKHGGRGDGTAQK
jgi:hypothetical protein